MIALVIRTIDSLKVFDTIAVISQGGPGTASETLNYFLYLQAFPFYNIGYASAVVVIFFVIIIALSLLAALRCASRRSGWTEGARGGVTVHAWRRHRPQDGADLDRARPVARVPRVAGRASSSCGCCRCRSRPRSTTSPIRRCSSPARRRSPELRRGVREEPHPALFLELACWLRVAPSLSGSGRRAGRLRHRPRQGCAGPRS